MAAPIEFFFDFSSPYGYLASVRIDEVCARHGREVAWRPYLMGVAMKRTGARPLVERDMVADYTRHDLPRYARLLGVECIVPDPFPVATVAACRAFYWLEANDAARAKPFASALYHAYFVDDRNIGEAAVVGEVADECGIDAERLGIGVQDQAIKDELKRVTDDAVARGIFGSPFFIVDGEPFWGSDRIDQVERWIETGGW